eukprot:Skav227316  [mRNA]  locus=scaffold826:52234:56532:+ [translate_table: standard]
MAEAFAGLGGWTLGATLFGHSPTLLVECDENVAMACSKSHGILCFNIESAMNMLQSGSLPDHFVLIAAIEDPRVWVIAGSMNIAHWMASPPCPPWSNASYQKGISIPEGAVFVQFAYMLGISHARCATLENVPGLPNHPHYPCVLQAFKEAKMKVVAAMIDKAVPLLPISRLRWLATCIREDVNIDPAMLVKVRNMTIPNTVPGIGKETSMGAAGAVQPDLQDWELRQLLPTNEALEIMSRPELLPLNMRSPGYLKLTEQETIKLRIKNVRQLMPNIMAMQGSQHTLPMDLLRTKGLHAWLLAHDGRVRYVAPFEVIASMGMPFHMCLPTDFAKAWRMAGNSLSVAHAGLQCLRTKLLVGDDAGLGARINDVFQLCEAVKNQLFCLDKYRVAVDGDWMYLAAFSDEIPVSPTEIVSDHEHHDDEGEPESSMPPVDCVVISPTMPFEIHDDVPPKDFMEIKTPADPMLVPQLDPSRKGDVNDCSFATSAPKEGIQCFHREGNKPTADGTIVHLLHSQHIWASTVLIPRNASVADALRAALPHASSEHFVEIFVGKTRVWYQSMLPDTDECVISFRPNSFPRVISACFMEKEQVLEVDLTWTVNDMLAYAATDFAILPTALGLAIQGVPCIRESFVLATDATDFQVFFIQVEPPRHAVPFPGGTWKRITMRHPTWPTLRTAVFAQHETVDAAIRMLCETNLDQDVINVQYGDQIVVGTALLSESKGEVGLLHLQNNPEPVPILIADDVRLKREDVDLKQMLVKTPFCYKSQYQILPKHWTILHMIHDALHDFKAPVTMITVVNGNQIPAPTKLDLLDPMQTIEVRLCPLRGGAKGLDPATKTLRDLLLARGVKSDDVDSRIQMIKAKISASDLAAMMTQTGTGAWNALKSKANEMKLRLITTSELKEHQKTLRQHDKPPRPLDSASSTQKPAKKLKQLPQLVEKRITIDPSHFHVPGDKVVYIDETKWGPDMKGVVITTPDVAMKRLPVAKLSADYLAMVVVTGKVFNGVQPTSVPAKDHEGKPTLAAVVVINFGDIEVTCRPSVPSTELQAVPTAILEITIVKQYVVKWEDVRNVHNYLGHHLPELRKGQVIASWAFRSYDANRSRTEHDLAHHIHGFIRIPEQVMLQALVRSGHSGIFIQVKGQDKRPDGRFGVIILHGMKLEEALQQATSQKNALGVVQLGTSGAFAIRAKREHVQAIRLAVHPQSIAMQEGSIPSGATWWVLKHVTVSTTCSDLTAALETLGWKASVVRPAGKTAWIACAVEDPPATHLCLGSDYVAVVPLIKTHAKQQEVARAETYVPVPPNVSMCPEDDTYATTSTSTRLSDLKDDLEVKLTEMINDRMKHCDEKIAQVATSVEGVRNELGVVIEHSKREFVELRDQQTSIQNQIQQNNVGMMNQMTNLFKQMQRELKESLMPTETDDDMETKRGRAS